MTMSDVSIAAEQRESERERSLCVNAKLSILVYIVDLSKFNTFQVHDLIVAT